MNNLIISPIGQDEHIQKLQTQLYEKLGWSNIEVYGRVFKWQKEDGTIIPTIVKGNEYKSVLYNDAYSANIFFISDSEQTPVDSSKTVYQTNIKVVVTVNLETNYPTVNHRADLEAQRDVIKVIKSNKAFSIEGIETELSSVLRGFSHGLVKLTDIQPRHIFGVKCKLKFNNNC